MTAYEAWTLLQELYHSASIANLLDLNNRFACLRQKVGQTAFQFITEVVNLANEIRDMGDDISDQKVKFQILGHLLPEFAPLVTTLMNIDGATLSLDMKTLREAIIREEHSLARNKETTTGTPSTINPAIQPSGTLNVLPVVSQNQAPMPTLAPSPVANASRTQTGCTTCSNPRHSTEYC